MGNTILSQCHTGITDPDAQKHLPNIYSLETQVSKKISVRSKLQQQVQSQQKIKSFPSRSQHIEEVYQRLIAQKPIDYSIQNKQLLQHYKVINLQQLIEQQQLLMNRSSTQHQQIKMDKFPEIKLLPYQMKPQSLVQQSLNSSIDRQQYRQKSFEKSLETSSNADQQYQLNQYFPSVYDWQKLQLFGRQFIFVGLVNQMSDPHGPGQLYSCSFHSRDQMKEHSQVEIFIQAQFYNGHLQTDDAIIIFNKNTHYRGGFAANTFNGKGHLKMSTGLKLSGNFVYGQLQGKGKAIYPDGGQYQGFFHCGLRQGKGIMIWKSQHLNKQSLLPLQIIYKGYFKADKMQGLGNLKTPNYQYWGPFVQNMKQGKGSIRFNDGKKFQGWFEKDEICGYGELHYEDGNVEKGVFPLNKRE